jgi:hypothetical protein
MSQARSLVERLVAANALLKLINPPMDAWKVINRPSSYHNRDGIAADQHILGCGSRGRGSLVMFPMDRTGEQTNGTLLSLLAPSRTSVYVWWLDAWC